HGVGEELGKSASDAGGTGIRGVPRRWDVWELGAGAAQRNGEVAAELLGEVDRDAGMHAALAVEQLDLVLERDDRAGPDAWMDVEAATSVAQEGRELPRRHAVTRQRQRHGEGLALDRPEHLTAVGMIVGAPQQRVLAWHGRAAGARLLGKFAPAEKVAIVDRLVAGIERVAAPPAGEDAFGDAALVAGVLVDRPAALRGPRHDLDGEVLGIAGHDPAVALEIVLGGRHDRRRVHARDADAWLVGEFGGIEAVHAIPLRYPEEGSQAFATVGLQPTLVVLGDLEPADLIAMDLVRAVGQAQRALVGVHAGQLEDLADAARAMQLQAAVDHLRADVGHRHLDHGDLLAGLLVAVLVHRPGGLEHQQARHVDLHAHVGDMGLGDAHLGDALAEGDAA